MPDRPQHRQDGERIANRKLRSLPPGEAIKRAARQTGRGKYAGEDAAAPAIPTATNPPAQS